MLFTLEVALVIIERVPEVVRVPAVFVAITALYFIYTDFNAIVHAAAPLFVPKNKGVLPNNADPDSLEKEEMQQQSQ
jgi:hypothetical protein